MTSFKSGQERKNFVIKTKLKTSMNLKLTFFRTLQKTFFKSLFLIYFDNKLILYIDLDVCKDFGFGNIIYYIIDAIQIEKYLRYF